MHKVKGTCFRFFFTLLACHIFIRLYIFFLCSNFFFHPPLFIHISLPYDPLSTDMCQCIGMASINIWLRIQEATCLIDFFHSIWQEWIFLLFEALYLSNDMLEIGNFYFIFYKFFCSFRHENWKWFFKTTMSHVVACYFKLFDLFIRNSREMLES